ncbi:MAG: hypothetical protein U0470_12120 [Anaerolineae bacterium]
MAKNAVVRSCHIWIVASTSVALRLGYQPLQQPSFGGPAVHQAHGDLAS